MKKERKFKIMFWLGLMILAVVVLVVEIELYPLAVQSLYGIKKTNLFLVSLIMFIIGAILVGVSYSVLTNADNEFKSE